MTAGALHPHTGVKRVDMHLHSTSSDGAYSPSDVFARALQHGVGTVALTDHDTLGGLVEARNAAGHLGLHFIPGIEFSAEGDLQVHILAYGVTDEMAEVVALVERMRADRARRKPLFLEKLRQLGVPIQDADLVMPPGTAFSRPILARAMVEKGYVESVQEAFERYIARGKPAYVPRAFVAVEEVIGVIRAAGGASVLAHPGAPLYNANEMRTRFLGWVKAGLRGVEAHHPSHSEAQRAYWLEAARQNGLFVTAGSDFHKTVDALHGEIGSQFVHWTTYRHDLSTLLTIIA